MDRIKDFLHDFSDIFFAALIAGIMFTVLAVNLGSWFNKPINRELEGNYVSIADNENNIGTGGQDEAGENPEETGHQVDETTNRDGDQDLEGQEDKEENRTPPAPDTGQAEDQEPASREQTATTAGETKKILVPSGTFSTGIAKILKENGLIEDTRDFDRTAENLNLANRLKAGSFDIPTDASIEEIVKIIAGQK